MEDKKIVRLDQGSPSQKLKCSVTTGKENCCDLFALSFILGLLLALLLLFHFLVVVVGSFCHAVTWREIAILEQIGNFRFNIHEKRGYFIGLFAVNLASWTIHAVKGFDYRLNLLLLLPTRFSKKSSVLSKIEVILINFYSVGLRSAYKAQRPARARKARASCVSYNGCRLPRLIVTGNLWSKCADLDPEATVFSLIDAERLRTVANQRGLAAFRPCLSLAIAFEWQSLSLILFFRIRNRLIDKILLKF